MSLRKKTLIIILFSMSVFLSVMFVVSHTLLFGGYRELEQLAQARDAERIMNTVAREIDIIERLVLDWAPWDDTYEFAYDRNEDYIRNNLQPDTLDNLDVSIFAILPSDDAPLFVREGTRKEGRSALAYLEKKRDFISAGTRTHGISGIFVENGVAGYLAAAPILRSDGSGPSRGTLGFLRVLDEDDIKMLSEATLIDLAFHPLESLDEELRQVASRLVEGGETVVTAFPSSDLAKGYAILRDIENKPAILLETKSFREIHMQGRATIRHFLSWLFLFGLFITGAILFLLQKKVIDRLRTARDFLDSIARSGAIRERLPLSGGDELTELSASVNSVLSSFEGLVENLPDSLFITEKNDILRHINREARDSLQYPEDALLGKTLASLLDGDLQQIENHAGDSPVFEGALRRRDGTSMPVELHRQSFLLGEKLFALTAARDLTERKELEEMLKRMAWFDATTGLPNRARFFQTLEGLLLSGKNSFAIILLDLDRFRNINNSVGTRNGDQVLAITGDRISECLAPEDIAARFGGDEFAILLRNRSDWESVAPVARSLKENAARPVSVDGRSVFPSISMGVLLCTQTQCSSAEIVERAEIALAKAKSKGIGHFAIFSEEDTGRADVLTAERELRQALRNGEFVLHYQPIHRMTDELLVGFEALIRWNHPQRGLVMPDGFIPFAEETGLIVEIDHWVVVRACQELARWEHALPGMKGAFFVSVNASGRTVSEGNYPARVLEATSETKINPSSLIIEVTEGVLIRNPLDASEKLSRLREGGVSIALDDFGTGYSSLQYLNSLPLDKIKIDRSFVQSMLSGEEHQRLVKGMLALASDLGIETVAEGIETEAEYNWLLQHGTVFGQGYFFGRPESAESALEKLKRSVYGL